MIQNDVFIQPQWQCFKQILKRLVVKCLKKHPLNLKTAQDLETNNNSPSTHKFKRDSPRSPKSTEIRTQSHTLFAQLSAREVDSPYRTNTNPNSNRRDGSHLGVIWMRSREDATSSEASVWYHARQNQSQGRYETGFSVRYTAFACPPHVYTLSRSQLRGLESSKYQTLRNKPLASLYYLLASLQTFLRVWGRLSDLLCVCGPLLCLLFVYLLP